MGAKRGGGGKVFTDEQKEIERARGDFGELVVSRVSPGLRH